MGFSARYHAASLAAVFFALAIGILIGSQIGGDILNSTRDSLEKSLTSDLDESRSQVDELQGQRKTADEFGNSVYPALVGAQRRGDRVGLVGFGDLPGDVTSSAEDAIDASGAELVAVGTVREPPLQPGPQHRPADAVLGRIPDPGRDRDPDFALAGRPRGPALAQDQDMARLLMSIQPLS